jgi:hypothetical protein
MDTDQGSFHLEEFRQLRGEVLTPWRRLRSACSSQSGDLEEAFQRRLPPTAFGVTHEDTMTSTADWHPIGRLRAQMPAYQDQPLRMRPRRPWSSK